MVSVEKDTRRASRNRVSPPGVIMRSHLAACVSLSGALPGLGAEQAQSADAFVDTIGIITHLHDTDTAYENFDDVIKPRLAELGIRHIRDGMVNDPENRICDPPAACGVARRSKWREPFHRTGALCSWTTSAFSGHQMGGQERQLKMDKSRRSGGFTNSTSFSRMMPP